MHARVNENLFSSGGVSGGVFGGVFVLRWDVKIRGDLMFREAPEAASHCAEATGESEGSRCQNWCPREQAPGFREQYHYDVSPHQLP